MSCVNILDNDTTLVPPTFGGAHSCMLVGPPTAGCGGYYHSDSAKVAIVFNPDGTWNLTHAGHIRTVTISGGTCETVYPATQGIAASGVWIAGAFNPADYEMRAYGTEKATFTGWPAGRFGSSDICEGTMTPPHTPPIVATPWGVGSFDTGWLGLGTNRETQIGRSRNYAGGTISCVEYEEWEQNFTIELRQISNHANVVTATGKICFQLHYQ